MTDDRSCGEWALAAVEESLVQTGLGEQGPLGLRITSKQPRARSGGPRDPVPLFVPQGGYLMHFNEPSNIPWWHGGHFGVVTSPAPLPPRSTLGVTHMGPFSPGPMTGCVVVMLGQLSRSSCGDF